ncbi:MAG: sulfate reduction electron transfer complex DsrMKJOP subunit DsrJ [Desulfobulbaceae bacterium]|jgi:hypothetical protein|nr:sulfate reduction electron transfer complex DsrMKJOP subunit DsrJ [Desulfobulbaceae bacterium]
MYNKGLIIPGLVVFVFIATFPLWYNGLSAGTAPKPEPPPGGEKTCVAPKEVMRSQHMVMLNQWRDEALRDGLRTAVPADGKEYRKGLQLACMSCHTNKDKFCDACHNYVAVQPYCWSCHLAPADIAAKKEKP